jgi:transcriptional regulator with XRE-family HTH domain
MGRPLTILGSNIKRFCAMRGKTQGDLAADLGIAPQTLSKIVCGGDPQLSTFQRIAAALHVGLDELAFPDDKATPNPAAYQPVIY